MNRFHRILVSGTALCVLFGGVAPAHADENSLAEQIALLNPGTSASTVLVEAQAYSVQSGQAVETVLSEALADAQGSDYTSDSFRPGFSGGSGTAYLGSGRRTGDVFYSPASTLYVNHGHSGLYSSTTYIVEAPGRGKVVRSATARYTRVGRGAKKQTVSLSSTTRSRAANFALAKRGKPYNTNFAFNKTIDASKYNCSQLVWAAFKKYGYDVDSNGGPGVYPSNIRDSSYTSTYQTL